GPDGDGDCAESCDEATGSCTAPDPNGSACDNGVFCDGTETCTAGVCGSSTGDPCPGPDGDGDCAESCDEATGSCTASDPDGSACGDPTDDDCTNPDTCDGAGACQDNHEPSGTACPDDGNDCTDDVCDGSGTCTHPNEPDGLACDNGVFCDGTETCTAGVCGNSTGDPCPGPDGDGDCAESCDEATGSCTASDPDGSACDDGLYCTENDTCSGGQCAGTPVDCGELDDQCNVGVCNPDSGECEQQPINEGEPCDDDNACTTEDTCSKGKCVGGPPLDCDDGDPCTIDSCDPELGCLSTPIECPEGEICVDGECVPGFELRTLIIKQGACPAPVNPEAGGVVPMALIGDIDFAAETAVPSSLKLRVCGDPEGAYITPIMRQIKVKDLNHPHEGEVGCGGCSCNEDQSSDGIDDLSMKFRASQFGSTLGLSSGDGVVTLELTGVLEDGTPIRARDCVRLVP
ncbi:MAG: hypothetical protein V3U29_04500, partial [Phycisphaeraceae bacterium]